MKLREALSSKVKLAGGVAVQQVGPYRVVVRVLGEAPGSGRCEALVFWGDQDGPVYTLTGLSVVWMLHRLEVFVSDDGWLPIDSVGVRG